MPQIPSRISPWNNVSDDPSPKETPTIFLVGDLELCTFKGRQAHTYEHQPHAQLPPHATNSFILLPQIKRCHFLMNEKRKEKKKEKL